MTTLASAVSATTEYTERMPKTQRKRYGQFFTSKETAAYMASLLTLSDGKEEISVLDPGAGSGILSVALLDRLQEEPVVQKIHLVCYENDPCVLELLRSNLEMAKQQSTKELSYEIVSDNYILSQYLDYNGMIGASQSPRKFDLIIGNPPYQKLPKHAPEARAMPDVCYGSPNLYFLFAAMSLFNLAENGEMVYIIPRSWTSGAYFKRFRQMLLREGVLEHIHLFVSRDKVFEQESVLQETMIIKVRKASVPPETVTVTTTNSNGDFAHMTRFEAPYSTVVNSRDTYIYLVTSVEESNALRCLNRWSDTLPDIGLRMKTGLTVDFRNFDALRTKRDTLSVPLFYPQHIRDGKVVFPAGREYEYISTQQAGLLQRNANYLFVKRFTAKEEPRRLQCGIYLAKNFPEYGAISTQNKINFIDGLHKLSECTVYGLYVLFNSTLYDRYYRILNGSTQVNSTEINSMPVPPLHTIEEMGRKLLRMQELSVSACDKVLGGYL